MNQKERMHEALNEALEDWAMMQKTEGDEGAEWAERFERHFYIFIDELAKWIQGLPTQPQTIEEAEELTEIKELQEKLPGPLVLNFTMELEMIIDGHDTSRFD